MAAIDAERWSEVQFRLMDCVATSIRVQK